MKRIIICWTPFNNFIFPFRGWSPGCGTHPALTADWIEKRYEIWKKFTYQSIASQEVKFAYYIFCNYLAKNITDEVFADVLSQDKRLRIIYFGDRSYLNAAKVVRNNYDEAFAIRIDSDDMYSRGTFKYIYDRFPAGYQYGFFQRGYGYEYETNTLWKYDCQGSGPFYCVRYPRGTYRFDPIEHPIVKKQHAINLEARHFVVNVHNVNHSTQSKSHRFVGLVDGKRKIECLNRFSFKKE